MKLSALARTQGLSRVGLPPAGQSISCDRGQVKISIQDVTLAVVEHICGHASVFVETSASLCVASTTALTAASSDWNLTVPVQVVFPPVKDRPG